MGLALDNWLMVLVILGLPFVTFAYRIRVEEKIPRAKFGETYEDYASTRWAILPFVW